MIVLDDAEAMHRVDGLGLSIVRFDNGNVRVDPPAPWILATLRYGQVRIADVLALDAFGWQSFYLIGRSPCCPLLNDSNKDLTAPLATLPGLSRCYMLDGASEVLSAIEEWAPLRVCTSNDFYLVPEAGSFMMYVSHHDEVLLWCGWDATDRRRNQGCPGPMN